MLPDVEVVCVMDVIKERAQLTAHNFGVKKWYSDYSEMLNDSEVQAVDICSPPHMHAEHAIEAAKKGKHILCEKPVATHLGDAVSVQNVIEKTGVLFMTGFTYRFHPLIQKIKEEIETPRFLRINYSFHPAISKDHWVHDFNRSGGFIIEQAVHWFDLFQWFSGKAKSVYAKGQYNTPSQRMVATISYENGTLGSVSFDADSPQCFFFMAADSSEKSATLNMRLLPSKWGGLLQIVDAHHKRHSYYVRNSSKNKTWKEASLPISLGRSLLFNDCHVVPFTRMIQYFVKSIQSNIVPEVSLDNGIEALKMAIAVQESIKQGKEITLTK